MPFEAQHDKENSAIRLVVSPAPRQIRRALLDSTNKTDVLSSAQINKAEFKALQKRNMEKLRKQRRESFGVTNLAEEVLNLDEQEQGQGQGEEQEKCLIAEGSNQLSQTHFAKAADVKEGEQPEGGGEAGEGEREGEGEIESDEDRDIDVDSNGHFEAEEQYVLTAEDLQFPPFDDDYLGDEDKENNTNTTQPWVYGKEEEEQIQVIIAAEADVPESHTRPRATLPLPEGYRRVSRREIRRHSLLHTVVEAEEHVAEDGSYHEDSSPNTVLHRKQRKLAASDVIRTDYSVGRPPLQSLPLSTRVEFAPDVFVSCDGVVEVEVEVDGDVDVDAREGQPHEGKEKEEVEVKEKEKEKEKEKDGQPGLSVCEKEEGEGVKAEEEGGEEGEMYGKKEQHNNGNVWAWDRFSPKQQQHRQHEPVRVVEQEQLLVMQPQVEEEAARPEEKEAEAEEEAEGEEEEEEGDQMQMQMHMHDSSFPWGRWFITPTDVESALLIHDSQLDAALAKAKSLQARVGPSIPHVPAPLFSPAAAASAAPITPFSANPNFQRDRKSVGGSVRRVVITVQRPRSLLTPSPSPSPSPSPFATVAAQANDYCASPLDASVSVSVPVSVSPVTTYLSGVDMKPIPTASCEPGEIPSHPASPSVPCALPQPSYHTSVHRPSSGKCDKGTLTDDLILAALERENKHPTETAGPTDPVPYSTTEVPPMNTDDAYPVLATHTTEALAIATKAHRGWFWWA